MPVPQLPWLTVSLTLPVQDGPQKVFFVRYGSHTYGEEKPVEENARGLNAKLLSRKPRRNDFHTHLPNHFIANVFWAGRVLELLLSVVRLGGVRHWFDHRSGDPVQPGELAIQIGLPLHSDQRLFRLLSVPGIDLIHNVHTFDHFTEGSEAVGIQAAIVPVVDEK